MVVYVENPEQTHTLLEEITFLYNNNEQLEFEIKNKMPFTLAPPQNWNI